MTTTTLGHSCGHKIMVLWLILSSFSMFASPMSAFSFNRAFLVVNQCNCASRRGRIRREALAQPELSETKNMSSSTTAAVSPGALRIENRRGNRGMNRDMSQTEMVAMSATGAVLTAGILYTLAMNAEDITTLRGGPASMESLEVVGYNIMDAALPTTAYDVLSVAIGEAIAGVIGATASFGISQWAMQWRKDASKFKNKESGLKISDAVADGDFLLTNAAAYPLFEAIGVPPILASVASTALAIVPYEIVKVGARRRESRQKEDKMMTVLLERSREKDRRAKAKFGFLPAMRTSLTPAVASPTVVIDPASLSPIRDGNEKLDLVEIFSDITKWLQFSVLKADLGGVLTLHDQSLPPGTESALFGAIAGLSSQIYADILYAYFRFGGGEKQDIIKSRTLVDWIAVYSSKLIYYAVLFGVYDAAQVPVKAVVAAILSGGAESCVGSNDYTLCIEAFVSNNPPDASLPAQARSLLTAAVSFWNNNGIPSWEPFQ